MYLEWMNEGTKHDTSFLKNSKTATTEFVGKQATVLLNNKLPCLDRSASSVAKR